MKHVSVFTLRSGFFIICLFEPASNCPTVVSVQFENQTVTNKVHVERQLHSKTGSPRTSITVCLPAVTDYFDALRPSRLVEFFEYQKLAGVKRVSMGELDERIYPFSFDPSSRKVLKHYKDIGFLEMHPMSVYSNNNSNLYRIAADSKPIQYTYCILKYALVTDYVTVQDLDEIVAFNANFYRNIPAAISAGIDKKHRYYSFKLYDQPVNRRCNFTRDFENNTNFIISRSVLFSSWNYNPGKTIHSSQVCLIPEWHRCAVYKTHPYLLPKKRMKKADFHKILSWKDKEGTNLMRSLHYRIPKMNGLEPPRKEAACAKNQTRELHWLDRISSKLFKNTLQVLSDLIL